jgi:hypothetical protein
LWIAERRAELLVVLARFSISPGIDPLEDLRSAPAQMLCRYAGDELAEDLSHLRRLRNDNCAHGRPFDYCEGALSSHATR